MKIVCMIPARLGSQRLKKKNLQIFNKKPLIVNNAIKAKKLNIFSDVIVNSESDEIGNIVKDFNITFYKRPEALANDKATSEQFVYDFMKNNNCDYLIQLHSIAPLIKEKEIVDFYNYLLDNEFDTLLSYQKVQIECVIDKKPINFNFQSKTNSQELEPIKRISWSITGWKTNSYINAYESGKCATYNGDIGYFEISDFSSIVVKSKTDLDLVNYINNSNL